MDFYLKDPDGSVDYAIDWSLYLNGRTIAASGWSVDPEEAGGVGVVEAGFDGARTAVRLGGGAIGRLYRVANHVAFSDGSSDDRSIVLRVEQR